MRVLSFDQDTREPIVRIPFALVLLIESDDHLNDIAQEGEGELVIEDGESPRGLRLLDPQGFQLSEGELISPPVSLVVSIVLPRLIPRRELSFVPDVGDAGEEGVVHDQELHIFRVDHVELNKISPLVEGC